MTTLILLGAGVGLGLTLMIGGLVPARPRLGDVLERAELTTWQPTAARAWTGRFTSGASAGQLDLAGLSRERFLGQRLGLALGGALWLPVLAAMLTLVGLAPPVVPTAAASLVVAVVGWLLPAVFLRSRVAAARLAFTAALASYFELVALARTGDRGAVAALHLPASIGSGWAFARIQAALTQAELRGEMPWTGLRQLATTMGIAELEDLGAIVTAAGEDGASIVDTLRAKAASMRDEALTAQLADANVLSSRMHIPLSVMAMALIVFMGFPGLYRLVSG